MPKVAVIGAGSWGTTVANVSAHNQPTMISAREHEVVDGINDGHENPLYLHGIRLQDRLTASQDLGEVLDGADVAVVGALAGPNIATEVADGEPALSVVAFRRLDVATDLLPLFHTEAFKVLPSDDVVGCEIAGAVKNVLALAAGMADGLGFGANTKAALIDRQLST